MLAELLAYLVPATSERPALRAGNLTEVQALLVKAAAMRPGRALEMDGLRELAPQSAARCSRASTRRTRSASAEHRACPAAVSFRTPLEPHEVHPAMPCAPRSARSLAAAARLPLSSARAISRLSSP
jgi:hypothetical protein